MHEGKNERNFPEENLGEGDVTGVRAGAFARKESHLRFQDLLVYRIY